MTHRITFEQAVLLLIGVGVMLVTDGICSGIAALGTGEIEVGRLAYGHRSGALRVEPPSVSQAKPPVAIARKEER